MSEIFVDTIRKTGGSLGTDIRVKNTSVYESDGGTSVTQNLVQGLAKCWVFFEGDASSISPSDSLNVGSLTDNGTGNYTVTFSNNMANANYMINTTGEQLSGYDSIVANKDYGTAYTTSESKIAVTQGSSRADPVYANFSTHGDLA